MSAPAAATDVAVVGGGIVGLATALALATGEGGERRTVVVLEAEPELARHQSGRNSGVIHSGLPYRPGSLKAELAVEGREAMFRFCAEQGLPAERCGKVVVAVDAAELPGLAELERRGRANGLAGLTRLDPAGLRALEPHATGVAALHVPETGIADFAAVVRALARRVAEEGGEVRTSARLTAARREAGRWHLATTAGPLTAGFLVNCAGLQSDRVARLAGAEPGVRIVPFRGDYFELAPEARELVRGLIYPVADAALPFLGVHLTRTVHGTVEAGPNAVPAAGRHAYLWRRASAGDLAASLAWPGTWRLYTRLWRTGMREMLRSAVPAAFAREARRLVPELRREHLQRGRCGIRAQAVDRQGRLVDDFHLVRGEGAIHVVNAPSPAATASLAIGRRLARWVAQG
ncbi:MAG TPA: L-2-hydroxyglutarate oxidase [Thermoanaerobaculia bacterium]|nr:L-2-hydroxyglutarate oxidase [Thermoanaerobaculia bacterium]